MKITKFTIVVSLMAILSIAILVKFVLIERWKSTIFVVPLLFTIYFYRKKVCYQCQLQDCPFHFKSKGNLKGFCLPILLFFVIGIVLMVFYNFII